MSRFTTRPLGPEPCTALRSSPRSRAMRLASGLARSRRQPLVAGSSRRSATTLPAAPPEQRAPPQASGPQAAAAAGAAAGCAAAFAPLPAMNAMGAPTGAIWPSPTTIFARVPSS